MDRSFRSLNTECHVAPSVFGTDHNNIVFPGLNDGSRVDLYDPAPNLQVQQADWSPSGDALAVLYAAVLSRFDVRYQMGLWSYNSDFKAPFEFLVLGFPMDVDWSPAGNYLAVVHIISSPRTAILTMHVSESVDTYRTQNIETVSEKDPTFSPDEKRIAFSSDRTGQYEIFVANIDGSGVMQVTSSDEFASAEFPQ